MFFRRRVKRVNVSFCCMFEHGYSIMLLTPGESIISPPPLGMWCMTACVVVCLPCIFRDNSLTRTSRPGTRAFSKELLPTRKQNNQKKRTKKSLSEIIGKNF